MEENTDILLFILQQTVEQLLLEVLVFVLALAIFSCIWRWNVLQ
jgi:uncharacterized membrane protein YbhN (UPF0104 family)